MDLDEIRLILELMREHDVAEFELERDNVKLRLRKSGTAGGQKGLQNTIDQLGTTEFARLRIGIDRPPPPMDATDYVLQKFSGRDVEQIEPAIFKAADAIELFVRDGVDKAMNVVNAEGKRAADNEDKDAK